LILFHCKDFLTSPLSDDHTAFDLGHKGIEAVKSGFNWVGEKLKEGVSKTEDLIRGENLTAE